MDFLMEFFETYHPNNSLCVRGNYIAGKEHGIWKYYDQNKKLIQKKNM